MMDSSLPVSARKLVQFDNFCVFRSTISPGAFPINTGGELRIMATIDGEWVLQLLPVKKLKFSHGEDYDVDFGWMLSDFIIVRLGEAESLTGTATAVEPKHSV